ncbi:Transducin/WD40 repeat-like superfamily protein [Prunus dulcis]|uniref:Transducin/WD40 repeat-like superfamily protein n=1 Tax=Prunus dulcis TaxID=3755 RepID=A0A4Y1RZR9_PRUDU|nr:Transducin/WD40 repeat-like superfamily protein [Prunus dulcis]
MAEEKAGNGDGGDGCAPEEEEKKIGLANGDGGAPPEKEKKKKNADPQLLICLLQPAPATPIPTTSAFVAFFSLASPSLHFNAALCNGKGYVAFRNYIRRPRNWENMQTPSLQTTPGNSGRWVPPPSPRSLLYDVESWSPGRDVQSGSQPSPRRSFGSSTSDNDRPRNRRAEPAYSFVGMHCILISAKPLFGHMSSDLLAYGASDGTLTVCTVSDPPSVLKHLDGHSKDVTDFDFSSNNQYIASSSMDKTVRVWEISKGLCIRVNNNFLSVGNADKEVTVTSMDYAHTGQLMFCGDATGCIYSVSMNSHTGVLSRSHRHRSSIRRKSAVTTVQYRSFSLLARGPVLLTCTQDGTLTARLGHRFPVIGVAWNHGENLLASSDFYGTKG